MAKHSDENFSGLNRCLQERIEVPVLRYPVNQVEGGIPSIASFGPDEISIQYDRR